MALYGRYSTSSLGTWNIPISNYFKQSLFSEKAFSAATNDSLLSGAWVWNMQLGDHQNVKSTMTKNRHFWNFGWWILNDSYTGHRTTRIPRIRLREIAVDGSEILHQLIGGLSHCFVWVSTCFNHSGCRISLAHPQYVWDIPSEEWRQWRPKCPASRFGTEGISCGSKKTPSRNSLLPTFSWGTLGINMN
jgi:hypothetical protein